MKKQTLDTAIQLGQLLALLNPLASVNKAFNGDLMRLRSGVENQVVLASVAGGEVASKAEACIDNVFQALLGSVVRHVDLPKLLDQSAKPQSVSVSDVVKGARRMNWQRAILGDAMAVKLERCPGKGSDQTQRAGIVHAYASAVRNTPWLPVLLRLELSLPRATRANTRMVSEYSSHTGREAMPETLAKLGVVLTEPPAAPSAAPGAAPKRTRAKKGVVKVDGLFIVQVTCKADQLVAHPDIAALASVTFKSAEPEPTLAQLLEKATTPVTVGPDEVPAAVAQRIIDELVGGLGARKKLADAERAAIRAQAEAAAADSAVAALQQLNPALVAALKKNPALLERV